MFVRVKTVAGRRYVYIAEGVRTGKQVKQKTYYLGSLSNLVYGIPDDLKRKIEAKNPAIRDWNKIAEEIRRIPLRFEEISSVRPAQYAQMIRAKSFQTKHEKVSERVAPNAVFRQRREGELLALSIIVKNRFRETYTEVEGGKLRMEI